MSAFKFPLDSQNWAVTVECVRTHWPQEEFSALLALLATEAQLANGHGVHREVTRQTIPKSYKRTLEVIGA